MNDCSHCRLSMLCMAGVELVRHVCPECKSSVILRYHPIGYKYVLLEDVKCTKARVVTRVCSDCYTREEWGLVLQKRT